MNLRGILIFLILFLVISSQAFAKVVIKAPSSSLPEYLAYIKTSTGVRSLADHQEQEERRRARAQSARLVQLFEQAQREFLRGDLNQALKLFQDIANLRHQVHWGSEERFAIHYSMLRAAQLSPAAEQQGLWLLRALEFDWLEEPDLVVFPPPLMQTYNQLKGELRFVELRPWIDWPHAHRLLVNGQSFPASTGEVIKIPEAQDLLISILSHSHLPLTTQVATLKLKVLRFESKALATGSCSQPRWPLSQTSYPPLSALYFNSECVVKHSGPSTIGLVSSSALEQALRNGQNNTLLRSRPEPNELSTKRTSTTWFWLGTAVLSSAILLHHYRSDWVGSKSSHTTPPPSSPSSGPRVPLPSPERQPDVTFGF